MKEKITVENWKETIEDGLFDWNKTESLVNFIQSLIDAVENHKKVSKKIEEDSDNQSKSRRLEIEKLNREVNSLLQEHKRLQIENRSLVNEYTTKLLWANMLIEVLSLIPDCVTDENVNLETAKTFISKANSSALEYISLFNFYTKETIKLTNEIKVWQSRNDSLIGLLKSIPCSLNDDGSYNKKVIKSFIQEGIAAKRKSGIYEVRFNGATSNVWLRWCENNKYFEAYGTDQKYYDKDMSYVAEKMSYDTEPRPF